ncbi:MAG: DNA polymerase III subunit beta [Phycisphaeraceae bacterium]|nr:DNA polymerase III subunit beta [Phycisphaeraceae bacterium]
MKVICDRAELVDLLNLAGGVILSRTPKPVLQCVKLTVIEDTLTVMATDMELAIRACTNKIEIVEPGEALIPNDKFNQIVREAVDPTITLEVDKQEALITGADSHFKIFGYPVSDFPPIPEAKGDPDYTINSGELHRLIRQTTFATARENSRYAINGVLVERDNNKLTLVATDGRRLAMAKGSCKGNGDAGPKSVIIPTKALTTALRLFDDDSQTVSVKVTDNQLLFATDTAVLSTNLVEGNFPPYRDVIPKDSDRKATMRTDVLASGVRRASLLTNEESKGVRMSFSSEGLTLSSRAPEMGEAEVNVPLENYDGEAMEIGFNPGFVSEALKVVEDDEVTLELKAPNKPGVLRTGNEFLYVIMPLNLQ